jgi:hypothetical protein
MPLAAWRGGRGRLGRLAIYIDSLAQRTHDGCSTSAPAAVQCLADLTGASQQRRAHSSTASDKEAAAQGGLTASYLLVRPGAAVAGNAAECF